LGRTGDLQTSCVFLRFFSDVFVLYYVVKIFLVVANCLAVTIINWKLSYEVAQSVSLSVCLSVSVCVSHVCSSNLRTDIHVLEMRYLAL